MDSNTRPRGNSTQSSIGPKQDGDSNTAGPTHKRSLSGSILSKIPFLKSTTEESASSIKGLEKQDRVKSHANGDTATDSLPSVPEVKKSRKRKGSLRKTALLGTGRIRQEKKGSILDAGRTVQSSLRKTTAFPENGNISETSPISPVDLNGRPAFGFENINSTKIGSGAFDDAFTSAKAKANMDSHSSLDATLTKASQVDTSTTDDEEGVTFLRVSAAQQLKKPGPASPDYFTSQNGGVQRRRSNNRAQPTLEVTSVDGPLPTDEWDYADTEWWGWVVLVVTWVVFVVGMGSCFGVWSWAWDVGETPYAPPELEDDATLPIVGYYPALIILTSVMAWVWVVIAWVGMKYFRHAKISGDET